MKRRSGLSSFTEAMFNLSSQPTPELLAVFGAGLLAVTVFSNWLYDVLIGTLPTFAGATLRSLGVTALLVLAAFLLWRRYLAGIQVASLVREQSEIAPHPGLIWTLSPGSIDAPLVAIQHHLPQLERLWLIVTEGDQATAAALEALRETVVDEGWTFAVEPVEIPTPDVRSTHAAVKQIYQERAAVVRLDPAEIVADITGGFKTMTAGVALACALNGWTLEYLASARNPDGSVKQGSQHLVRVDAGFVAQARIKQE
jgi:hypothetical protein